MCGHLLHVPAVVDRSWRLCYAAALQLQSSRLYLLVEGKGVLSLGVLPSLLSTDSRLIRVLLTTTWCAGDRASQHVSARVLTKLAWLFDTAAAEGPERNLIPLLPSVGWTTGAPS